MPIVECTVCGPTEHAQAFIAKDYFLRLVEGDFPYWRCSRCGTVRLHPLPDDETIGRAYATYHEPLPEQLSKLQQYGEKLAQREATLLTEDADPSRPLVDVGCGAGAFLRRLQRTDFTGELRGVEFVPEVAARATQQLGLPVEQGTAEGFAAEPGSLGTIVMRHVIEHLKDPGEVLARFHTSLEPGGTLYLGTPDSRALSAKAFGKYWHGWDPPRHLHIFTNASLKQLVSQHGFEPVRERWFFSPQMWIASLRHSLTRGHERPRRRRFADDFNPVLLAPSMLTGAAEVAARRSTMYALTARRSA